MVLCLRCKMNMKQSNLLPKTMSAQEVLNALSNGKFDNLIGAVESEGLEFKGAPYRLDSTKEKLELAKDISASANAGGGIIVMGIRTCVFEGHPHEVAEEIRKFEETLVDIKQYEDVAHQWIYPRVSLEIKWVQSVADRGKGLAYIRVPESQSERKPFLTVGVLQEDDKKLENVVGFFQRKGDRITHMTAEELHHVLKDGLRFDEHLAEISETFGKVLSESKTATPRGIASQVVNQRIENAIEAVGLKNSISYVLVSYPNANVEIPRLFESRTSDVMKLIDEPPQLRYGGFDITTEDRSKIVNGEFRRSVLKSYKLLEVWQDGTIVFVADGDEGFLCWGNYDTNQSLRVNTIGLVESVYLFSLFVKKVFEIGQAPDCGVRMEFHIRNIPTDKKYGLPKAKPGSLGWRYHFGEVMAWASSQDLDAGSSWEWRETAPEKAAYKLVTEIYGKFGVEHEFIPYVKEENGEKLIDVEKIRNIR